MTQWWQGLAPNERLLVYIAAALSALLVVWQLVLTPTLSARAAAQKDLQTATRTMARVQEAYMAQRVSNAASTGTVTSAPSLSPDAFRTAVTQSATDKGLSISRLQGDQGSTIGLVFDRADPRFVFFWLEDVETNLGGRVMRLSMERVDADMVRCSVDIEG